MGRITYDRTYAADFETTVYDGQKETQVWSSAMVELYTEDVITLRTIDDTMRYLEAQGDNSILYYHNLKFDGSFLLDYFLREGYLQAYWTPNPFKPETVEWLDDGSMPKGSIKYSISDKGQWYTMVVKTRKSQYIKFIDSLKLMPFTLAQIGDAYKTKHRKTTMDYSNHPDLTTPVTEEEWEYIRNDVLVLKEALEFMFNEGHDKLTIGACCLAEFKRTYDRKDYKMFFPDMTTINIDSELFQSATQDAYVRKSYKGAWTYIEKSRAGKVIHNGLTLDVNSLYPSVMHSKSGNRYPVGKGVMWKGDYIPDQAIGDNKYYFIRIRTSFRLREGYLPTIQIKGDWHYKGTEYLTTSDYVWDGKQYSHTRDDNDNVVPVTVVLTLTMTDYALIQEHYELYNTEILDGIWFYAEIGLFDQYIDHYMEIKMHSTGAMRTEAKLFLNNLYGKLAASDNSSFKIADLDEEGKVKLRIVTEHAKKAGYIPCGSAVTSYARDFTIRHAQMNYRGDGNRGFIYADTDSLHCDLTPEDLVGINIHESDLLCWKCESLWDWAIFVRQKTYMEHVTHADLQPVDPKTHITCAGMPDRCKQLFSWAVEQDWTEEDWDKMKDIEREYVKKKKEWTDFKIGLVVPSKLMPERVYGGIVLRDGEYTMRP